MENLDKDLTSSIIRIEKELLKALLSYQKFDDLASFIDIISSLNKKGVNKKILIDILHTILRKLDDSQIVQETIIGDVLDYITGWATPRKNTKEYSLFIQFNSEIINKETPE